VPITLTRAQRTLGPALELHVAPNSIQHYATGKLPGVRRARASLERLPVPAAAGRVVPELAERLHPFVLGPHRYPAHWPVTEDPKALRLLDLLDHLDRPESSSWWSHALERLDEDGSLRIKGETVVDEAGVQRHLEDYLLPLIARFAQDGYRADLDVEPGRVHVGPDGALHKTNKGVHRFLLARHFGGDPLRVQVTCVHADWWAVRTTGRTQRARLASARDALRGVAEAHRG
jgi:hypothetical protein